MKKKFVIAVLSSTVLIFITSFNAAAQNENTSAQKVLQSKGENKIAVSKNFIKINLTALLLKNYSIQYERALSKSISFAFSYRTMPLSTLPFHQSVSKLIGDDDPETKKTIEDFRLSNNAFTPEIRFYLSRKGYGRGFYIAPFYRHANFKASNLNIFYADEAGNESSIKLSGKLTSNTGGLLFGVQKAIGKRIVLDTWLFGPHYGSGKGDLIGTSSRPLSQSEQDDLRDELEGIDIPLTDKTVNVNANGASVNINGPWAGIRAGFSLGIKF